MKLSSAERADVLIHAMPYIRRCSGSVVVIKYGGSAMAREELRDSVIGDVVLLSLMGVRVVLVHGGGPEITEALKKAGKKSSFVDGLRVTDRETMEIVQMVLAGKINKGLVNRIESRGGSAVGLCGMDGGLIEAEQKDARLGYVGRIVRIRPQPVLDALEKGYIPVLSPLGRGRDGSVYNINADTAAARIAAALRAESLVSLTDTGGVLRDPGDPSTRIPEITADEARRLAAQGVIRGGMIPKAACCAEAVRSGVRRVFIADGRVPHAILMELLTDGPVGTVFEAERNE